MSLTYSFFPLQNAAESNCLKSAERTTLPTAAVLRISAIAGPALSPAGKHRSVETAVADSASASGKLRSPEFRSEQHHQRVLGVVR